LTALSFLELLKKEIWCGISYLCSYGKDTTF